MTLRLRGEARVLNLAGKNGGSSTACNSRPAVTGQLDPLGRVILTVSWQTNPGRVCALSSCIYSSLADEVALDASCCAAERVPLATMNDHMARDTAGDGFPSSGL